MICDWETATRGDIVIALGIDTAGRKHGYAPSTRRARTLFRSVDSAA